MSELIRNVTDASFDNEVLASPVPVLVDLWAQWCGPCKMIAPLLNDSAASYAGQLNIAKINIDENPKIPSRFHVRSIPTLLMFKGGQLVGTKVGALSKSQLSAFIEDNL
jgi:thioredoxin 1